jgi:hypothetical protein
MQAGAAAANCPEVTFPGETQSAARRTRMAPKKETKKLAKAKKLKTVKPLSTHIQ